MRRWRLLIGGQNLKSMEKCHNQKQSETTTRAWDLLTNWSKISQHIEFTCTKGNVYGQFSAMFSLLQSTDNNACVLMKKCNHSITLRQFIQYVTLAIAQRQHGVQRKQGKQLSANVANIKRFDHVDLTWPYDRLHEQKRSCKECNKKANPMWEKCDASLSSLHPNRQNVSKPISKLRVVYYVKCDALKLNIECHYVPPTSKFPTPNCDPRAFIKATPYLEKFLFLFLVHVLFTLIIVTSAIFIAFFTHLKGALLLMG